MTKKRMLLLAALALLLAASCGQAEGDSAHFPAGEETAENESGAGQAGEGPTGDSAVGNPSGEAASRQSLAERIAVEISCAVEREAEVQAAGLENGGGSMQPLLEAMKAAELTKARVSELAKCAEEK